MKKIVAIIVAMAMIFPVFALAEVPDISGLTKEEMIELDQALHAKLGELDDFESITLSHGEWTVGKEIPEGTYKVSSLSDTHSVSLYIDGASHDGFVYIESAPDKAPFVLVTLVSGTIFRIAVDDLQFTPVTALN